MRTHLDHSRFSLTAMIPLAVAISGCALVEGIFKTGIWVGVLSVVGLAGVIVVLLRLFAPR
jgi:hypothetical protein